MVGHSKYKAFADLKAKVEKRVKGWKESFLSQGGREVLIKAVAQAIPTYTMNCFKLPNSLCNDISGLIRRFWWGQRNLEKKIHWVSWEKLCCSKFKGGLGFRYLKAFNLALLAKQGWRLLTDHQSLFAKVFKARYFPRSQFWDAPIRSYDSFAWKSIAASRNLLKNGANWRVGNGSSIRIWGDRWMPDQFSPKIISPVSSLSPDAKVEELLDPTTRLWNRGLLNSIFLPWEADQISRIPLSPLFPPDLLYWSRNKSGLFSVRSAYHLACDLKTPSSRGESSRGAVMEKFWKQLWHLNLPRKIKLFLWRSCRNSLPIGQNLMKRNIQVSPLCTICGLDLEIATHNLWCC